MVRTCLMSLALSLAVVFAPCDSMAKKSEQQVQAELDKFVLSYVDKANKRMTVNRQKPRVVKQNGKFIATFTEIDRESVSAQVHKSRSKHFEYVAQLRYHELTWKSVGKSRKAALNGPWECIKVRRLIEMPRYVKGKWEN